MMPENGSPAFQLLIDGAWGWFCNMKHHLCQLRHSITLHLDRSPPSEALADIRALGIPAIFIRICLTLLRIIEKEVCSMSLPVSVPSPFG